MSPEVSTGPRRTTKLLVAVAAALTLAGCGSLRPGVAAEVGDTTISMDRLDAFAGAFCHSGLLAQNGQANTVAQTRVASVGLLVRAELAREYADEFVSSVPQSEVDAFLTAQVEPTVADLPDEEREEFLAEIRDFLVATQLAQNAAVARVTAAGGEPSEEAVGTALNDLYAEWGSEAGVELDPRFGTWSALDVAAFSGSLSVPATDDPPSTTLPGSRSCG